MALGIMEREPKKCIEVSGGMTELEDLGGGHWPGSPTGIIFLCFQDRKSVV